MRSLHTTTKGSPHLPQLEKARAQRRRPNAAKNKINKYINKYIKKKKRMEKWNKQGEAVNKGHVIQPATVVGERSWSCWGNYGSKCKTLTFSGTPPKRWQSWGTDIPVAIRATLVRQGLIPSCGCEQSRLPRLWRKPLDKEMQELAVERQLVHTQW